MRWFRNKQGEAERELLTIDGELQGGPVALTHADCASLPRADQIEAVDDYAADERGRGVRLHALFVLARPAPEALYLDVRTRSGSGFALFSSEVRELGILVYALDGWPLPESAGGPFRLVLPGFHDERRSIAHVTRLTFALQPVPDARVRRFARPGVRNSSAALYPPAQIAPDPGQPRSGVVPPPTMADDADARG
jgi:DMSO/TMAO reductase YedYZ molybdopterin-dependent catalytic subunit